MENKYWLTWQFVCTICNKRRGNYLQNFHHFYIWNANLFANWVPRLARLYIKLYNFRKLPKSCQIKKNPEETKKTKKRFDLICRQYRIFSFVSGKDLVICLCISLECFLLSLFLLVLLFCLSSSISGALIY